VEEARQEESFQTDPAGNDFPGVFRRGNMTPDERRIFLDGMVRIGSIALHKCPNNGKIIESTGSDDKALCGCGKVNPKCPMEHPGVHVKRFLTPATVTEYINQEEARRRAS
jgi:hypothetical protein